MAAKQITVLDGQTLLDITLQEAGDLLMLMDLAKANGLSITATLTPGQSLTIPDGFVMRANNVAAFSREVNKMASEFNTNEQFDDSFDDSFS